jgi:hypothetical protein
MARNDEETLLAARSARLDALVAPGYATEAPVAPARKKRTRAKKKPEVCQPLIDPEDGISKKSVFSKKAVAAEKGSAALTGL